jgi:Gelsolin repeat
MTTCQLITVILSCKPHTLVWQAEAYIDDNLRTIAKAHRAAARRRSSSSTSAAISTSTVPATLLQSGDQPFPEELSRLIHLLYHLRRGPLLGRMLQSADESQRLRTLFLRGDVQRCVCMLAPTLLSATVDTTAAAAAAAAAATAAAAAAAAAEAAQQQHYEGVRAGAITAHTDVHNSSSSSSHTEHNGIDSVQHGGTAHSDSESSTALQLQFEQVPPETLRLLPDSVLLLDTYDNVYVWIGRAVPAATAAAVRVASLQQVQRMTAERFPAPRVLCVADGSSFARFVTCRLGPSHRDPPVGSESSAVRQLRKLLPYTDDLSYREYFYYIVAGR